MRIVYIDLAGPPPANNPDQITKAFTLRGYVVIRRIERMKNELRAVML